MKHRKVLAIALDGLEYDYVEKGNLRHLMQEEYGKVRVPILYSPEPSTPIVWTSFITGKEPHEHGIDSSIFWNNSILRKLQRSQRVPFRGKYRKILKKLGFSHSMPRSDSIIVPTIFDKVEKSVPISIPVLNENIDEKFGDIDNAIFDTGCRELFLTKVIQDFHETKKEMYDAIDKNMDLIVAHFQYPDLVNHIFFNRPETIMLHYQSLDNFVSEIDFDGGLKLIVSDHGITSEGGHSHYGFYSSNRKLGLREPNITEFHDLLLKEVI